MEYIGLRWYKCDFHLHTMSSKCYKDKDDTPQMWVEKLKEKGLQCIAISDHNDYRGIKEIKKLSEKEGIVVFPAVELSCDSSKVHLLIIFDVSCDNEEVRDFLAKVGIVKDSLGDSGKTCDGNIAEVCEKAQKSGALVIAAHIDEFNGISEISYDNMKKILDRKYINAVQVVNKDVWTKFEKTNDMKIVKSLLKTKYGKEISDDKIKEWYNAYDLARKSELPILSFSDNPSAVNESTHGLWGIGKKYSWLKMDKEPNLESVRQALISYDMRVKCDFDNKEKPNIEPELWIRSIRAKNTILNEEEIFVNFNPQLNAIIGGRGSGKSSIIRMLAGGMASFDGNSLESIKNEQDNFYKMKKKEKNGIEKGIFKDKSVLEIELERGGDLYKIQVQDIHDMQSQNRILYKYEEEDWIEISDRNFLDFFKAQVYTQKQIYELALDSNSLLGIIDEDIENLSEVIAEKDAALSSIIAKTLELSEIEKVISTESKIETELKDIERQIHKFESSGISDILKKKQKYALQQKITEDYFKVKDAHISSLEQLLEKIVVSDVDYSKLDNKEIEKLIKEDVNMFSNKKKEIYDILLSIKADRKNLYNLVQVSNWKKEMCNIENNYMKSCASLEQQGIKFDKLDELLERKKEKMNQLDKIKEEKDRLIVIRSDIDKLRKRYEERISSISKYRSEFIKRVIGNDTNVKFDIKRKRNRNSFILMMKSVLQKDTVTFEEEIIKLADIFFAKDGTKKFKELISKIKTGEDTTTCHGRMNTAIKEMTIEAYTRMLTFIPDDDLQVSYKPEGAKKYIPLSNASAGQKTTAILTFLLAYGKQPLLLDQPEDDLDNKLVYDLIVTRLKKTKTNRQVIVVTHNANIPVNADAEHIISMDSETDKVRIKNEGTMDNKEIRKEICDVMEGTKYAFEMRAKKYHFQIVE